MYTVKFGYHTGKKLVFTVFQPDGTGRGDAEQSLPEVVPHGYYRAIPYTDIVEKDVVVVYEQYQLTWEDDPVGVLAEEQVYYESEPVGYEGAAVYYSGAETNQPVYWTSQVRGNGEYIDYASESFTEIDNSLTTVTNVYPAALGSGGYADTGGGGGNGGGGSGSAGPGSVVAKC